MRDSATETVAMKLMTAHKILIGTSVVFFVFLSGWEFANYLGSGEAATLGRSVLYLGVAVGFAIYFASLRNKVL